MGKKIILVDDNTTFLMFVGLLLKRFDFKVMPAESGIEALRLIRLTSADLMIIDVHMQDMDGFTVLRHIKDDKRTAHIPVIMTSVDTSRETIDACKSLGCFDFLAKPIKVKEIHGSIQRCFFAHRGTNRQYLRAPFTEKVLLRHDGDTYDLYAETLSEKGLYLRKEKPLPVNSQVIVEIPIGNQQTIRVSGAVIYVKQLFGDFLTLPPGMAIHFNGLDQETEKTMRYFIEDLLAKDILDEQGGKIIER